MLTALWNKLFNSAHGALVRWTGYGGDTDRVDFQKYYHWSM